MRRRRAHDGAYRITVDWDNGYKNKAVTAVNIHYDDRGRINQRDGESYLNVGLPNIKVNKCI